MTRIVQRSTGGMAPMRTGTHILIHHPGPIVQTQLTAIRSYPPQMSHGSEAGS